MILTSKIELCVTGEKEEKAAAWQYLRKLSKDVFRAYNRVISTQYFNELFTTQIRKTDGELAHRDRKLEAEISKLSAELKGCKDKEVKEKLKERRNKAYKAQNMLTKEARIKAEHMYASSEENSTYQLIGKEFPDMSSYVMACVNSDAVKAYRNDAFDVKMGLKSIRSYRDGVPIPFQKKAMRFFLSPDKKEIGMKWIDDISFLLVFGRDKSNNREIVNRVMNGIYEYSDSKIKIVDRKIFLLLCVNIPEEKTKLDPNLIVGVNLGLIVPAYCALSDGMGRMQIGSSDDFLRVRIQMQDRRRRLQSRLRMATGGHGRDDKLKALESLSGKERSFAHTYNHMVSFQIIKFALKYGAGTIKMELLEGYGEDEKNSLILRNWSYFELHSMVEYKAKKWGINVVYTDPYRISQTCNCCGEYDENNLEDKKRNFVCKNKKCKNYGEKVFSDYNAALNNAQSLKIVSKKEECQFYKLHKGEFAE